MLSTSQVSTSFINNSSYNSIFRYSSLPTDEIESKEINQETTIQLLIRRCIIIIAFTLIILTFPISIWFSIKRIKPLERCIIYRLGKRLPIKGPGLVFAIPCIDVLDHISLSPHKVCVAAKEQMLTTDGSLIEIIDFSVEISVSNAIRSSTQLKDSRQNIEQFIKLSFVNTIGGTHVEDLERKMEFISKQYEEHCNRYINKWGWSLTVSQLPRMVVLSRAEPVNHVVQALKSYFGVSDQNPGENNLVLPTATAPSFSGGNVNTNANATRDEIAAKIETLAESYRYLSMMGISKVTITLEIAESLEPIHYELEPKSGKVVRIGMASNEAAQITVKAATWKEFHEAIDEKDTSKVQIISNLI